MKLAPCLCLLLLCGCALQPAGTDDHSRLFPAFVSDSTSPTGGFVPTAGLDVDTDGDPQTCILLDTVATRTLRFAANSQQFSYLNILSGVTVADGSASRGTVTVAYSLDDGTSFQPVWSATGAEGRALRVDSIPLPQSQRSELLQVQFSATMPPQHFADCDVWLQ